MGGTAKNWVTLRSWMRPRAAGRSKRAMVITVTPLASSPFISTCMP